MDKVTKQKKAYQILIDVFEKDLWHDLKRDTDKSKRLSHEDKRLLKVYVNENYEKVISSDYPYSLLFEAFYHKMPIRFADFLNVAQQIRVYYQSICMPAQKDWQLEHLVYHNYFKPSRYLLAYYPRKRLFRFGETTTTMTSQWTKRLCIIDSQASNLVKLVGFYDDDTVAKILMWRILRAYSNEAFEEIEQMNFNNAKMSELCSNAGYSCF
ncbi:hypothetical protein FGL85_08460 [Leuconostoc pseudomesenteroides]|uniref:Uncharacterized protein n=1 Tax=Leuconostoc pseudomesenteroides TaxID=33968 RepID=A0A5B8T5V9_LEUPS|nr:MULTISPECIES: hypothetical protein [Leuconostoc]APE76718.1 hypothetical protein ARA02_05010 [Leuconostoc mesenteroides subsp. jonggajibkimchii]QEA42528.1 hypothetical protein FGL85_08460 [Leuconostoc pseudomesenteroides]